ncbi:hypothetical protein AX17_006501 [Amanita inopinata Kibby_2008]|nr:hypothetical protein AX17_006501 [Amanita inopinata Kibby_2008]
MGLQLSVNKRDQKRTRYPEPVHYLPYPIPAGYGNLNPWMSGGAHFPPPVIPPNYNVQGFIPPALPWPASQHSQKRKRRRTHAGTKKRYSHQATMNGVHGDQMVNFPAGFVPSAFAPRAGPDDRDRMSMPNPVIPGVMGRVPSQGQPPPLFTPGGPNGGQQLASFPSPEIPAAQVPGAGGAGSSSSHAQRRAPTPFVPPMPDVDDDDDDDDDDDENDVNHDVGDDNRPVIPTQRGHRQTASMPEPMHFPPAAAVMMPQFQQPQRRPNPLPEPPRILYDRTPFQRLVDLPTGGLSRSSTQPARPATTTAAVQMVSSGIAGIGANGAGTERRKTKSRLLRAFSLRGNRNTDVSRPGAAAPGGSNGVPVTRYVPVFMSDQIGASAGSGAENATGATGTAAAAGGPSSTRATASSSAAPTPSNPTTSSSTSSHSTPHPPLRFTQTGPYSGFVIHSPHPVSYRNKIYKTATHLFEAMKYVDHAPECAERIRECEDLTDVYRISASFSSEGREKPDWAVVFLSVMEDVLYMKFAQHDSLRRSLLDTGQAPLVYSDPNDGYWGEGPVGQGTNELGKALVRVRDRLRANGYT